jgi:hypothetical protein
LFFWRGTIKANSREMRGEEMEMEMRGRWEKERKIRIDMGERLRRYGKI